MISVAPERATQSLARRLDEVAPILLGDAGVEDEAGAPAVEDRLESLVAAVTADPQPQRVWLLLVAVTATFPTSDEVLDLRRRLQLDTPSRVERRLLDDAVATVARHGTAGCGIRVVRDQPVVDVDFSAKYNLHTGIQRVVRRVAPRWAERRSVQLAAWTRSEGAYRSLDAAERTRVLRWGEDVVPSAIADDPVEIVVPWETTVVLPEVPGTGHIERLIALARFSGNRVGLIGYDCIPVIAADLVSDVEPSRFVNYLTLVKYSTTVATISAAVGVEFAGFRRALATQGLVGPRVVECSLGVDRPDDVAPVPAGGVPEVLVVGSHDRRKNQSAVLHAAELAWRDGRDFMLRLVGHRGFGAEQLYADIERMRRDGRKIVVDEGLGDRELWEAYRRAAFTVFVSLQEGYGLPVVESLSLGTPVIATDYGSVAEVAAGGGAVLVDPRDDLAIAAAMGELLDDPDRLAALTAEAVGRRFRTWDDYAADLWREVVER